MSFEEALARFHEAHPEVEAAEVYVVDLNGLARGKVVPIAMLEKLARGTMKMPVSTLGLDIFSADVAENRLALEIGDPDGALVPVAGTLAPVTWAERPTAQVQCMMGAADGQGLAPFDPRAVLARVVERAGEMGLTPVCALELEFYMVDRERPRPPLNPLAGGRLARSQLNDLGVMRAFDPVLSRIAQAAQALGAPAETVFAEFGEGQFEMNLTHVKDALAAADHLVALRRAIRGVARAEGMDATFMAKPYGDSAGSGMHIHLSLLDGDGRNVFDGGGKGPNEALRHALGGLVRSMGDATLIFAPHANSYRRLAPGSYAPIVAAWGLDNRGTALRLPEVAGPGARLEHRVAGADANPYLLTAAVLGGVLDGLERKLDPGEPVAMEAGQGDGPALPLSWLMAEQRFAGSDFIANWLGPEFRRVYGGLKRQERATMQARVPDTEYDAYLRVV